jgi:hypothetical protein
MRFRPATCTLLSAILVSAAVPVGAAEPAPDFSKIGRPFLEKHCLGCHSGKEPSADLSLESFRDAASLVKQRKVWEAVRKMVSSGEMPPKEQAKALPAAAETEAFLSLVGAVFDHADRNAKPDPGRVTMRRLNRTEYRNTIRDLVGVDFDPTEDFPSDDIGHGFDNIGDVLTLPPLLMERYLAAADNIMSRAIVPNPPAVIRRHLSAQFTEPASSEVAKKVIEGGWRRMSTDGKEFIEVGPVNTAYLWEPDGEYDFRTRVYAKTADGSPVNVSILLHGKDLPDPSPAEELSRLSGNVPKPSRILKTVAVKAADRKTAETIAVRIPAIPNRHRMVIAVDKPAVGAPPATLYVEYLALDGPLDTRPASHRKLLACDASKPVAERTREVLGRFLRRAYRRPPTAEEFDRVVALAEKAIGAGEKWEGGIQLAMQAALCSPKFLFRVETDDSPTSPEIRPLDDFQLASRLS